MLPKKKIQLNTLNRKIYSKKKSSSSYHAQIYLCRRIRNTFNFFLNDIQMTTIQFHQKTVGANNLKFIINTK